MSGLTTPRATYKPFQYPWAYDAWLTQQKVHWLPEEVPLADDVKDWHTTLTESERHLVTQIFRFFTQSDVEVNGAYTKYQSVFKPMEVLMMLQSFQNIETIHISAYSHLLDTIGMPEAEYSAFMHYTEMRAKHDYLQNFNTDSLYETARTMAAFGAFAEGMALFASFAILLNFPRYGKMRGMGQIVTWSVRDETLHCVNMCRLYRTFIQEHPWMDTPELEEDIRTIGREMVAHEDAFIDLAFEMGDITGLSSSEVKLYIRFIADRRFQMLGYDVEFGVETNPIPWIDDLMGAVEHANFFENRSTEYSRASTQGSWDDAFAD